MNNEYESPVVIDYEEGYGTNALGVIVIPLIVVAVYSALAGAIVAAVGAVPAVVFGPVPESDK